MSMTTTDREISTHGERARLRALRHHLGILGADGSQYGLVPGDPPLDDVGGLAAVLDLGDPSWSASGQREALRILLAFVLAYPGPAIEPVGLRDAALAQADAIADRLAARGEDVASARTQIAEARARLRAAEQAPPPDDVGRHSLLVVLVGALLVLEVVVGVLIVLER
jgi:hypothetical protein